MAGHASILTDGTRLSRLDQQFYKIENLFALISGLAAFSLMILAVVSVGGRNFFNRPLSGYVDWIELIMPLIAFMAISYTQRDGGHIRMDIVVSRLRGRVLWCAEFLTTFLVILLMILLIWGSWAHFQRSFDWGSPMWSRDSTIDIGLPIWPAKLLVPVAFSILALRLALQLWAYGRAILTGTGAPVAIPLIEDAAQQAMREAETLGQRDPDGAA